MLFIKLLCSFIIISISLPACAAKHNNDAEFMMNRLLHIDSEKFVVKTESGEPFYNSLLEYKEWENIYIQYSKFDDKEAIFTKIEMKKLLFIGYIARTNLDAAISESFASDLVPIFNNNSEVMFDVISELNFLMPSTCYYLNRYFSFEGDKHSDKKAFIKKVDSIILQKLGNNGEVCLKQLMQH